MLEPEPNIPNFDFVESLIKLLRHIEKYFLAESRRDFKRPGPKKIAP